MYTTTRFASVLALSAAIAGFGLTACDDAVSQDCGDGARIDGAKADGADDPGATEPLLPLPRAATELFGIAFASSISQDNFGAWRFSHAPIGPTRIQRTLFEVSGDPFRNCDGDRFFPLVVDEFLTADGVEGFETPDRLSLFLGKNGHTVTPNLRCGELRAGDNIAIVEVEDGSFVNSEGDECWLTTSKKLRIYVWANADRFDAGHRPDVIFAGWDGTRNGGHRHSTLEQVECGDVRVQLSL